MNETSSPPRDATEPDPLHPADWALLALDGLVVLFFVALSLYLLVNRRRRHNKVLNFKSVPLLICIMMASTVNILAILFANNHFWQIDRGVSNLSCTLWSIWMQFFFGLTLWIVFMIARVMLYIFTLTLVVPSPRKQNRYIVLVAFVVALPVMALCFVAQFVPSMTWRSATGHCHLSWRIDLPIIAWIFLCTIIFYVCARVLIRHSNQDMKEFDDTRAMSPILTVALVTAFICCLIVISGANARWWGRLTYGATITLMHLLTILFICGKPLIKSLRKDQGYMLMFTRSWAPETTHALQLRHLFDNYEEMRCFLTWCEKSSTEDSWLFEGTKVHLKNASECILACIARDYPPNTPVRSLVAGESQRRRDGEQIMLAHVVDTCTKPVTVPTPIRAQLVTVSDRQDPEMFRDLTDWLERVFETRFWSAYAASYNQDVLRQKLLTQQQMQQRGFIDLHVMREAVTASRDTNDSYFMVNLDSDVSREDATLAVEMHRMGDPRQATVRDGHARAIDPESDDFDQLSSSDMASPRGDSWRRQLEIVRGGTPSPSPSPSSTARTYLVRQNMADRGEFVNEFD